jgi:L-malate glycosyltransferase
MIILSSALWYPEFKGDIRATYVHDINRHLLLQEKNTKVVVVTPNYNKSLLKEEMDRITVHRFNAYFPPEFGSGKMAQSKKSVFTKMLGLYSFFIYMLKNFYYTYKFAKKYKADLIHAHWALPTGFPALLAAQLLGIPCFITMHGGDVYYNKAEGYDLPKRWYAKLLLSYTFKYAKMLTAITNDCKMHAENAGARSEKIIIITNGADIRRFSKSKNGVENLIKKYSLKSNNVIFTCRQLIPRKGIRFLIMAMPDIIKKFPKTKLLIAGDGMEREFLEELIDKLKLRDHVTLLGWIKNEELPVYFNSSDVAVMPSLEEGFGIPAAEAMACEIPVVSTDAGGLVEVVDNNKTGIIVPKANEKEMAKAIIKLLENPALSKRMGKAGRKKTEEEFSWDITAKKFITLFKANL